MFPFQTKSSITFTSAILCQVGIWNFVDVFERYRVNTVTPSESQTPGCALITLFPLIIHGHTPNSTPKCISSAICDGLHETTHHLGKTVLPTRNILASGRVSNYLFCKGNFAMFINYWTLFGSRVNGNPLTQ